QRQFFKVNVMGTSNLVKGLGLLPALPHSIVLISSVSVYGLREGTNIMESHPLGAGDAYGRSKIQAENLLLAWCEKHKLSLTILRLPLIAGPNPPGNLGAMIRGIQKGYYLNIAGGTARKSMVMASDVAAIIPTAANHPGIYHLTDGHHPSIKELSDCIARQLGVRPPRNISLPIARALGRVGDAINLLFPGKAPISTRTIAKLTASLTFDDATARKTSRHLSPYRRSPSLNQRTQRLYCPTVGGSTSSQHQPPHSPCAWSRRRCHKPSFPGEGSNFYTDHCQIDGLAYL